MMGNPLIHWELMVADTDRAKVFYTTVFDWQFDDATFPEYAMIATGSQPGGGMMAKPETAPMPALNTYFAVDDADETLAKAAAAGGVVLVPKTPIEGVGFFAMFADPEGIPIGILESSM